MDGRIEIFHEGQWHEAAEAPEPVQGLGKIEDFQKTLQQFGERLDANTRMVSEAFAKLSETWPAAGRDAGKVDGAGTVPAGKPAAKKRRPRSS